MISLEDTLYYQNKDEYQKVEKIAFCDLQTRFRNSILRDDLLRIVKNTKDIRFLKFPIDDPDIMAFSVRRKNTDYIFVNSYHQLDMQIFAVAHELYHVLHDAEYRSSRDELLPNMSKSYETGDFREKRANCYAACLLVPSTSLYEEILSLEIDRDEITILDVLKLMDAFAVPYAAMILRLFENGYLPVRQARELLKLSDQNPQCDLYRLIQSTGHARRWKRREREVDLSAVTSVTVQNFEDRVISYERLESLFEWLQLPLEEYVKIEEDL